MTAQKREQNLQDVPAAITAIGGDSLRERNFPSVTSIATQVPNFTVTYDRGVNSRPNLNIRGVRSASSSARVNESSVAMYQDEVYIGDETMLTAAIFDLQRVEVLRGPQGTLFGRNTTGGLGHFISATPTSEFSGFANALYGSDNWTSLEGAVSGPVSDYIRVRLAGKWDRHDGHYTNLVDFDRTTPGLQRPSNVSGKGGARNVWGIRGIVDIDLSDNTLFRVIASHSQNHSQSVNGNGAGTIDPATGEICSLERVRGGECVSGPSLFLGVRPNLTPRKVGTTTISETDERNAIEQKSTSVTGKLTVDMDWATLTSITNYSKNKYSEGIDADGGLSPDALPYAFWAKFDNKAKQFSEELRLSGTVDDKHNWVAGAFYYQDRKSNHNLRDLYGFARPVYHSYSTVDTKSAALFSQVDLALSDQFTLTVGGRYTTESRDLKRAIATVGDLTDDVLADFIAAGKDPKASTNDLTGKIGLTWKPSSAFTGYLSYSRGTKSVAYNTDYSGSTTQFGEANVRTTGPVGQEKLDAFEIGLKTLLLNDKLSINSALFYYNFEGKQEILFAFENFTVTSAFLNVGTTRSYGAEAEFSFRPTDRWELNGGFGLLSSKITKSDVIAADPFGQPVPLEGLPLPYNPKWNANATLAYHTPAGTLGTFTLQSETYAQARQSFSLTNQTQSDDLAYATFNFRILWKSLDDRFNVEASVTNAFNKGYYLFAYDTGIPAASSGYISTTINEPRVWAIKLGANF